jgi:AbrB family looped-hinge helix DNA binding protein
MTFVRIKAKYQLTIPVALREQLNLSIGDLLEAALEGRQIILVPKKVIDRDLPSSSSQMNGADILAIST